MSLPTITAAWLQGDPAAATLLPRSYATTQTRLAHARAVQQRPSPAIVRQPGVLDALAQQHGPGHLCLPPCTLRGSYLTALQDPQTLTVTTGQQMGLLGGPLFNLAKVATAIALAKDLQAQLGTPVVPVFWLQNEDHDLPEIDHTFVPGPDGQPLRLGLDRTEAGPERLSVADRVLPESVAHVCQSLQALLQRQGAGLAVTEQLTAIWRPGVSWTVAFAQTLQACFPAAGLVFVDARYGPLAKALVPLHLQALDLREVWAERLLQRDAELAAAGFRGQVHVRPGAPLAFLAPEGPGYERFRLQPQDGDSFALVGDPAERFLTLQQVQDAAVAHPGALSSSALLRPMVQDALLPNAAYVAGPGELAYFAQIAPLYPSLGLPEPMVMPRARLRVQDERSAGWLAEVALSADAVRSPQRTAEALTAASSVGDTESLRQRLLGPLLAELEVLRPVLTALDGGLDKPLNHAAHNVTDTLDKLVGRIARSVANHDQVRLQRLERLRQLLWPDDQPQERAYGPAWFLARFGPEPLLEAVQAACARWDGGLTDVVLEPAPHAETVTKEPDVV